MSGSITIPASEMAKLHKTLQNVSTVSKKTNAQLCNDTALDWAFKAVQQTDKADAEEIAHVLGRVAVLGPTFSRSRKTGEMKLTKGRSITKEDSYAARIINTKRIKEGLQPLFGKKLGEKATRFINFSSRSAAFIKSGWLGSIQKLKAAAGKASGSTTGAKVYGKGPKGTAVAAKEGLQPFADIINTANKGEEKAAAVATAGLLKALPLVIADKEQYYERKIKEAIAKHI